MYTYCPGYVRLLHNSMINMPEGVSFCSIGHVDLYFSINFVIDASILSSDIRMQTTMYGLSCDIPYFHSSKYLCN